MKKFSVIIPIYNVEEYLEETIESVINQTIGFEENIELILMNDGSPDNSEEICLKYKELYPDNIKYIKQNNAGVSVARNNALKHATGEIVNFLDSDDKWSLDAFEEVYNLYQNNKDVKIYSCRMDFFDACKNAHPLNYKYEEDKIIDIKEDYQYIQLSTCSCFVEREVLIKYEYDYEIKNEEDTRLINEILLDYEKMYVMKKPIYHYRKRQNESSASQTSTQNKAWYTVTPIKVYKYLFDKSEEKYGKVLEYFQYLIAYDLGWRFKHSAKEILTEKENKEYIKTIDELFKKIDEKILYEQKHITNSEKLFIKHIKTGKDRKSFLRQEKKFIIGSLDEDKEYRIRFIHLDDIFVHKNKVHVYGRIDSTIFDTDKVKININGKRKKVEFYELKTNYDIEGYNNEFVSKSLGFHQEIDFEPNINFGFNYGDNKENINLSFSTQCVLNNNLKGSYYTEDKKTITYNKGTFRIYKKSILRSLKRELKNIKGLIKEKKYKQLLIRLGILTTRPFFSKNIWILSDRVNIADDNAEHLFKYINETKPKKVKAYYAISKSSPDFKRMKQYGKVLDVNSLKYKLLFTHSKYIVSAHAEVYITNIFGKSNIYYKDIIKNKYIFLQHGITKDDISPWLNPHTKHIDMFVSAATLEYESFLNYGYIDGVMQLTGFARYDGLKTKEKIYEKENTIMLSLTWRSGLANKIDKRTGKRVYNDKFKESDYFKFINNFMNDEKLHKVLEKYNYKIRFIPHPNVLPQLKDFKTNKYIQIEKGTINYQKEFCSSKLMITDYSSVFFDFAYLKKPTLYYQADKDEFYKGQVYDKGYFDFEKIGFGKVIEDYDALINEVSKLLSQDCQLEKKYEKRIDNFFTYNDNKNCERIFNCIKKL